MHSVYSRFGKRVLDAGVALCGLFLFAPLLALIMCAVLCMDGRPVLFRQVRVGRRGCLFRVVKFRTMRPGADGGGSVTVRGDSRITRVGAALRRWKLDELPQLWNVLLGEMSLVGPRPDVPGYADRLCGADRRVLELRPGITGPATLAYRDEERLLASVPDPVRYNDDVIFPEKVRINLRYLEEMSLMCDLKCILATLLPARHG